jgi:prephenate dehydrogenase
LVNAERTLYYAAPFILTPLHRTTDRARAAAGQVIAALGARPILLDPAKHDRTLAHTSHPPYLLASMLSLSTPDDCAPFIGPGFHSTSRLAGTPSSMMMGVLQTNRENLLNALEALQDELALLTSALAENDYSVLESTLDAARTKYTSLVTPS